MTRDELLRVHAVGKIRRADLGFARRAPQAAVVGIAVSDHFEIVFDTLARHARRRTCAPIPRSRSSSGAHGTATNAPSSARGSQTSPAAGSWIGSSLCTTARFPDGPERRAWPGLIYVRVKPTWIRYSNFSADPPEIVEFDPSPWGRCTQRTIATTAINAQPIPTH